MKKASFIYYFNSRNLPPCDTIKQEHTIKLHSGFITVIFHDKVFELGPGDSLLVPENLEYKFCLPKKRGKLEISFEQKIESEVIEKIEEILQILQIEDQTDYQVIL